MGTIFIISENSQNNYKGENSASVLLTQETQHKETQNHISCTYCWMAHPSNWCHIITDIQAGKFFIRDKSKCFNSLGVKHMLKNCWQYFSYYSCGLKHIYLWQES